MRPTGTSSVPGGRWRYEAQALRRAGKGRATNTSVPRPHQQVTTPLSLPYLYVRLTHRTLVGLEQLELGRVDRLPVVFEDPARVARVRVPGPIGVADPVLLGECDQRALPYPFRISAHRAPA